MTYVVAQRERAVCQYHRINQIDKKRSKTYNLQMIIAVGVFIKERMQKRKIWD